MATITSYTGNPTQANIDEYVEVGNGQIVHRYDIIGTSIVCYVVYEPSSPMGKHSSITHTAEYGWLGDMTTRQLPALLEAMRPGSQERITAVCTWLDGLNKQARGLILAAFPGADL